MERYFKLLLGLLTLALPSHSPLQQAEMAQAAFWDQLLLTVKLGASSGSSSFFSSAHEVCP